MRGRMLLITIMKKSIFKYLYVNDSAFKDSLKDNHKNLHWKLKSMIKCDTSHTVLQRVGE